LFSDQVIDIGGVRKQTCSPECGHILRCQRPSPLKTPEENIREIAEMYKTMTAKEIAISIGQSVSSVRNILGRYVAPLPLQKAKRRQRQGARQHMLSDNPMKHPETRRKVSEWWKAHPELSQRILLKARLVQSKKRPTRLEQFMFSVLEDMGVGFEPYAVIKPNFIVDAKIETLILQADGDYWHGHPRFAPLTKRQIAQQRRDAAQDRYLTTCGFTVTRIWESDMSVASVHAALSENGILPDD